MRRTVAFRKRRPKHCEVSLKLAQQLFAALLQYELSICVLDCFLSLFTLLLPLLEKNP